MKYSHNLQLNASPKLQNPEKNSRLLDSEFANLRQYLDNLAIDKDSLSAEEHEAIIVQLTNNIGKAATSELFSTYDIEVQVISVENQTYRHKHKANKAYQTAFGTINIKRNVYVNRKSDGDGKSICPMELESGIIANYWSPTAAKNACWALAHLTSQETEELLLQFGQMNPSRSSLERLPKLLMGRWEPKTIEYHKELMVDEVIPKDTHTVAVSLEGVMVAMKPEKTNEKAKKVQACDWREASCGTISFFNQDGERLSTIQYGRMPEHKKVTLKTLLSENLNNIIKNRPNINIVYVADGAQDNWCFFNDDMPQGYKVADFYHACEYLKSAYNAYYSSEPAKATKKFHQYKTILRDEEKGIDTVLRALRYLRQSMPNNKDICAAFTYFKNNQERMHYAEAKSKNYPIGSGVVEAACKSLVGQRLKRSGMSWGINGGQSILTLRALVKSRRFEKAWGIISDQFTKKVLSHQNVVNLFA